MSKSMADTSNGVIFSTLNHTDPHTVRGRSTQKDGVCNEHIFRNGSFRELKIAKESSDLAKVLLDQNQIRNQMGYQRTKHVGRDVLVTDNRRTFTNQF